MVASAARFEAATSSALVVSRGEAGFASGGVRLLLRLEGVAAFAVAIALYAHAGFSWPMFVLLLLSPDLAMLGYLAGPRFGAATYNLVHTYTAALPLVLAGFFAAVPALTAAGLILIAHIGFDRALGFGLKYSTAFGDTHLGRSGRR